MVVECLLCRHTTLEIIFKCSFGWWQDRAETLKVEAVNTVVVIPPQFYFTHFFACSFGENFNGHLALKISFLVPVFDKRSSFGGPVFIGWGCFCNCFFSCAFLLAASCFFVNFFFRLHWHIYHHAHETRFPLLVRPPLSVLYFILDDMASLDSQLSTSSLQVIFLLCRIVLRSYLASVQAGLQIQCIYIHTLEAKWQQH